MTIYVTYEPRKGNVWGSAILDQNMTLEKVCSEIERIKSEAKEAGVTATFQTSDELLGNFLKEVA